MSPIFISQHDIKIEILQITSALKGFRNDANFFFFLTREKIYSKSQHYAIFFSFEFHLIGVRYNIRLIYYHKLKRLISSSILSIKTI